MIRHKAMLSFKVLLVITVLCLAEPSVAGDDCIYCDKNVEGTFLKCLIKMLLDNPNFQTAVSSLKEMIIGLVEASKAMDNISGPMKDTTLKGAMMFGLANLTCTGGNTDQKTVDMIRILQQCHAVVGKSPDGNFFKELVATIKLMQAKNVDTFDKQKPTDQIQTDKIPAPGQNVNDPSQYDSGSQQSPADPYVNGNNLNSLNALYEGQNFEKQPSQYNINQQQGSISANGLSSNQHIPFQNSNIPPVQSFSDTNGNNDYQSQGNDQVNNQVLQTQGFFQSQSSDQGNANTLAFRNNNLFTNPFATIFPRKQPYLSNSLYSQQKNLFNVNDQGNSNAFQNNNQFYLLKNLQYSGDGANAATITDDYKTQQTNTYSSQSNPDTMDQTQKNPNIFNPGNNPQADSKQQNSPTTALDNTANCMKFAKTLYVLLYKALLFAKVFHTNTTNYQAKSIMPFTTYYAFISCGYSKSIAQDIAKKSISVISVLPEGSPTSSYAKAITKLLTVQLCSKNFIGNDPDGQALTLGKGLLAALIKILNQSTMQGNYNKLDGSSIIQQSMQNNNIDNVANDDGDVDNKDDAMDNGNDGPTDDNSLQSTNQQLPSNNGGNGNNPTDINPTGNGINPTGNGINPTDINPTGNDITPIGNGINPTGNGINPIGSGINPTDINPTGNDITPIGNGISPTGNGINPTGNDNNPIDNFNWPPQNQQVLSDNDKNDPSIFLQNVTGNSQNPDSKKITKLFNTTESTNRVKLLMQLISNCMKTGKFDHNQLTNGIGKITKSVQDAHPDWAAGKPGILVLIETIFSFIKILESKEKNTQCVNQQPQQISSLDKDNYQNAPQIDQYSTYKKQQANANPQSLMQSNQPTIDPINRNPTPEQVIPNTPENGAQNNNQNVGNQAPQIYPIYASQVDSNAVQNINTNNGNQAGSNNPYFASQIVNNARQYNIQNDDGQAQQNILNYDPQKFNNADQNYNLGIGYQAQPRNSNLDLAQNQDNLPFQQPTGMNMQNMPNFMQTNQDTGAVDQTQPFPQNSFPNPTQNSVQDNSPFLQPAGIDMPNFMQANQDNGVVGQTQSFPQTSFSNLVQNPIQGNLPFLQPAGMNMPTLVQANQNIGAVSQTQSFPQDSFPNPAQYSVQDNSPFSQPAGMDMPTFMQGNQNIGALGQTQPYPQNLLPNPAQNPVQGNPPFSQPAGMDMPTFMQGNQNIGVLGQTQPYPQNSLPNPAQNPVQSNSPFSQSAGMDMPTFMQGNQNVFGQTQPFPQNPVQGNPLFSQPAGMNIQTENQDTRAVGQIPPFQRNFFP